MPTGGGGNVLFSVLETRFLEMGFGASWQCLVVEGINAVSFQRLG
jgi:hypothetical protein